MLTVLMETRNHEAALAHTLSALVSGAVEGLVREVIVLDRGSEDGTAQVADAAGCRFLQSTTPADILRGARGEWLLVLEPGARPLTGWIDETIDYINTNRLPAAFSLSRHHRPAFWTRLLRRQPPFESGLLLLCRDALSQASHSADLAALARNGRRNRLKSEIVPASSLRR